MKGWELKYRSVVLHVHSSAALGDGKRGLT